MQFALLSQVNKRTALPLLSWQQHRYTGQLTTTQSERVATVSSRDGCPCRNWSLINLH
jgi:hypothetical protein